MSLVYTERRNNKVMQIYKAEHSPIGFALFRSSVS